MTRTYRREDIFPRPSRWRYVAIGFPVAAIIASLIKYWKEV